MTFETFNEDYVRRLAVGDAGAGDHFASYFGDVLLQKLRVRLHSRHLMDDVRQETLTRVLAILREGPGVERPERFGAFVNGVCNNVVREFSRSAGREELWTENIEEPIDATVDLDAELMNSELKREIERIFTAMSEKDRQILQAVYLDEVDKAEVCRRFHVDPVYLRVLMHRARAHFRRACRGPVGQGVFARQPSGTSSFWSAGTGH